MISPKKLIKLAKKWQKLAAKGRKGISFPRTDAEGKREVADKGHFVVYSSDLKRFMIPLAYINTRIFQELLERSEEEFGLSSDGPIMMPCDSVFMDYILSVVRKGVSESLERALLDSAATYWCLLSASSCQELNSRHSLVPVY
ncbi:auxin-responsive protein SAUR68-like [Punica granatum]|uniref:Auxin-responsive protein SAUR68-like n=1 Tax=Punica granatum TaxID=22663 RepID=A0A218XGY4_PUNGR|nr:auxin-responsive protein SAUR68-like [Punica granatum]OWM83996.1 hypothetical protein CDL15_Pgr004427 [Punica granatum]